MCIYIYICVHICGHGYISFLGMPALTSRGLKSEPHGGEQTSLVWSKTTLSIQTWRYCNTNPHNLWTLSCNHAVWTYLLFSSDYWCSAWLVMYSHRRWAIRHILQNSWPNNYLRHRLSSNWYHQWKASQSEKSALMNCCRGQAASFATRSLGQSAALAKLVYTIGVSFLLYTRVFFWARAHVRMSNDKLGIANETHIMCSVQHESKRLLFNKRICVRVEQ